MEKYSKRYHEYKQMLEDTNAKDIDTPVGEHDDLLFEQYDKYMQMEPQKAKDLPYETLLSDLKTILSRKDNDVDMTAKLTAIHILRDTLYMKFIADMNDNKFTTLKDAIEMAKVIEDSVENVRNVYYV